MTLEEACSIGYSTVYFTFDCIGDTILLMSALKYLVTYDVPKVLVGTAYREIFQNCDYIDILDEFYEDCLSASLFKKVVDAGINPVFISSTDFVKSNNTFLPVWGEHHILHDICVKLGISQTIPITPFFYLSEVEKLGGRFWQDNQIAIMTGGNQRYKEMSADLAQQIIDCLKDQYHFIQIGSPNDHKLQNAMDCRGWNGIRGAAMILNQSDLFIGGIGGLMHLARAVNCRSVIAYSSAEPLSLANYSSNINVFAPEPKCKRCGERESFPYTIQCDNHYSCIEGIKLSDMIEAVHLQLSKKNEPLEVEREDIQPNAVLGMEAYLKRFGSIKEIV